MAIKASDLRLGNWINLSPHEGVESFGKVLSIGSLEQEFEQLYCECEESFEWAFKDNYRGIPLDSDILIKCGFEKSEGNKYSEDFTFDKGKLSIHLPSNSYKNGRTYFNSWCIIEGVPESLHQLMNLFYCLTNIEIEYKP